MTVIYFLINVILGSVVRDTLNLLGLLKKKTIEDLQLLYESDFKVFNYGVPSIWTELFNYNVVNISRVQKTHCVRN